MSQIEAQSFESSKVSVARQMIAANCLTSFQVRDIMSNFGFESSRVEIAKAAWFRVVDPQQYYIVNDVFNFSSSSRELADFIEQNPR